MRHATCALVCVVEDLEAYQANPEAYLAKNPLEIKDPLLKDRRPRTEWKFEELEAAVREMKSGRNFGNGKQMFTVGTCIACHKMENVGNVFGPDLTQYDPRFKQLDMLKDMLEPSFRINEKFQTWSIETKSGKKFTGLIVEEEAKGRRETGREPAREGGTDRHQAERTSRNARSRRSRLCPRACSTN